MGLCTDGRGDVGGGVGVVLMCMMWSVGGQGITVTAEVLQTARESKITFLTSNPPPPLLLLPVNLIPTP